MPTARRGSTGGGRTYGRGSSGDALHVRRVQSLVAGADLELDFLSLGERLEPVHLNGGEVYEHVFAAFLFDEAITLGVIEPLHFPYGHASCLQRSLSISRRWRGASQAVACGALYRIEGWFCQENARRHNRI